MTCSPLLQQEHLSDIFSLFHSENQRINSHWECWRSNSLEPDRTLWNLRWMQPNSDISEISQTTNSSIGASVIPIFIQMTAGSRCVWTGQNCGSKRHYLNYLWYVFQRAVFHSVQAGSGMNKRRKCDFFSLTDSFFLFAKCWFLFFTRARWIWSEFKKSDFQIVFLQNCCRWWVKIQFQTRRRDVLNSPDVTLSFRFADILCFPKNNCRRIFPQNICRSAQFRNRIRRNQFKRLIHIHAMFMREHCAA